MSYTYRFPRPAVSTDCVVLSWIDDSLKLLLIQRHHEPFADCWALPGGFLEMDEDIAAGARRELLEETGVELRHVEFINAYGAVNRDPRTRVISLGWMAMVRQDRIRPVAGDDAKACDWYSIRRLPTLAFDHQSIVKDALAKLADQAIRYPVGSELLPRSFTLQHWHTMTQELAGKTISFSRFRGRVLQRELVLETKNESSSSRTKTYRVNRSAWRNYEKLGLWKPGEFA